MTTISTTKGGKIIVIDFSVTDTTPTGRRAGGRAANKTTMEETAAATTVSLLSLALTDTLKKFYFLSSNILSYSDYHRFICSSTR